MGLEREPGVTSSWVLPLLTARVATTEDKELVGAHQLAQLLQAPELPFGRKLTVAVVDSSYSKPAYLYAQRQFPNLVTIVRVRGTRTFYRQPEYTPAHPGTGHPQWYGARFALADTTQS